MSAYCGNYSDSRGGGEFLSLAILVILCLLIKPAINLVKTIVTGDDYFVKKNEVILLQISTTTSGHAFKHGLDAEVVRECIEQNGVNQTWYNSSNGHKINLVCIPEPEGPLFGIQVLNRIEREITAFIKDPSRYKTLDDVMKYLTRSGYEILP